MSNIAEGYERNNLNEFARFLGYSKASCAEVRSLLYAASDLGYLSSEQFSTLMSQAESVAKLSGAFLRSAERRRAA